MPVSVTPETVRPGAGVGEGEGEEPPHPAARINAAKAIERRTGQAYDFCESWLQKIVDTPLEPD
jgi:hypothetical protein